jgi:hypothetical protein
MDKYKFIKDIVENSVVAVVAEDSENSIERHQELSNYGSMGKAASVRSSNNYKYLFRYIIVGDMGRNKL